MSKPILMTCHGYTGYPEEMDPLGNYFKEKGFEWINLTLPGHATSPEDLKEKTHKDWTNYVDQKVKKALGTGRPVVFAGLSLGGAITLYVLENHPEVAAGIALAAPTQILRGRQKLLSYLRFLNFWIKKSEVGSLDVVNSIGETHRDYKRHHTKSVRQLHRFVAKVKSDLSKITKPLLVIHGNKDRVIPVEASTIIENSVNSTIFEKIIVNAGHVLTRERDRDKWISAAFQFVVDIKGIFM